MKISSGLVIIQDNKILLVHPTNHRWWGTYSIPKGEVEEGEDLLEAALRESQEELGIKLNIESSNNKPDAHIDYTDEKGIVYKKVFYFVVEPEEYIEIDKNKLQKEEVDWAGFINKEEAKKRICWRMKSVLNHLK